MNRFMSIGLPFGVVFFYSPELRLEDKYPSRAIELVVPFGPGGTADVSARTYSDDLAKLLKVPITVVNRAGGTGIQGTTYVIKSKKDGYTLLAATGTPLVVMPVISKEVTYDPLKDVVPMAKQGRGGPRLGNCGLRFFYCRDDWNRWTHVICSHPG